MSFRSKIVLFFLIIVLAKPAYSCSYSTYTINFFQKIFTYCYQWWFDKSDERIVQQTMHILNDIENQYSRYTIFFKTAFPAIPDTYQQHKQLIEQTHEAILFQLVTQCLGNRSVHIFLQELSAAINQLQAQHTILAQQIYNTHKSSAQIAHFCTINSAIIALINYLEFIYDFIAAHESYFILFHYEKSVEKQYQKELHALEEFAHDTSVQQVLHACIIKSGSKIASNYQLASYIKKIHNDIQLLSHALENIHTGHKNRIIAGKTLIQKLQTIADTLSMHIEQTHGVKKVKQSILKEELHKTEAHIALYT